MVGIGKEHSAESVFARNAYVWQRLTKESTHTRDVVLFALFGVSCSKRCSDSLHHNLSKGRNGLVQEVSSTGWTLDP